MENTGITEELKQSLFTSLLEQGSEALIYADHEGMIRLWNVGAEKIFGHAAADVMGQSLDIIVPEKLRSAHWKGFHAALESGTMKYKDQVMTTRAVHKDGSSRYVDLSFFLVKDAQGATLGSFSVARDCTERFQNDRATKARLAELEQNAQPSAKS